MVADPGISNPGDAELGAVEFLGSEVCCDAPFIHTLCREQNTYCKHCMMASVKVYACYAVKIKKFKQGARARRVGAGSAWSGWHPLSWSLIEIIPRPDFKFIFFISHHDEEYAYSGTNSFLTITTNDKRYSKILIYNTVWINGRTAYFAPVLMKMSCCEFCMNTLEVNYNTPLAWFPICYGDV